jgi:hypothetical protein
MNYTRAEAAKIAAGQQDDTLGLRIALAEDVVALYDKLGNERLAAARVQRVGASLLDENKAFRKLLVDLVESEDAPCVFDHDGNCQEHGHFGGPCPIPRAREMLGL